MKRLIKNTKKLIKGAPTAVVVSILFHAGLFALAGALVIFTIVKPKEIEFEPPPPVKVPKMPLKKLQVKMKKPTKPKSTAKITAVVNRPDLHDIQFPDLASSGIGAGLSSGGEMVSFGDMPSFEDEDSLMGSEKSIGNDLEGTYYDIKRTRSGNYNGSGWDTYAIVVAKFLNNDWDLSTFAQYYKSPKKLYATCVMVPNLSSSTAPKAFGEDPAGGGRWVVYYKGKLVYPEDITFRFWVVGDYFLGIRVDKQDVMFAGYRESVRDLFSTPWRGNDPQKYLYYLGHGTQLDVGDWITLKAGEAKDIEIVMGDEGGLAAFMILVEVEGVEYPQNKQAGPILPVFKVENLSHDQIDAIYRDLPPNEFCLTNGPVFRDY